MLGALGPRGELVLVLALDVRIPGEIEFRIDVILVPLLFALLELFWRPSDRMQEYREGSSCVEYSFQTTFCPKLKFSNYLHFAQFI